MEPNRRTAAVLALVFAAATAAQALTLVNFDAGATNLPDSYTVVGRPYAQNNATNVLLEFNTDTRLFVDGPRFYGGLHITNTGSGGTLSLFRYHQNVPPAWPNVPMVFFSTEDSSGGASYNICNVLYLWQKPDFVNLSASSGITFSPTDELRLRIAEWNEHWTGGAGALFRFVVREGTQYYISQAATNISVMPPITFVLTNFNNNSAVGFRWAPFNPTASSFDMPGGLTYSAQVFTNVTAVGWLGRGSGAYGKTFAFRSFSATGLPEPAAFICLAGLAALIRRARR